MSEGARAYTAVELADLRRCSLATVYRWVKDGTIRALPRKHGAPLRFPGSVVESMSEVSDMGARYDEARKRWCVDFYYHHPDGSRERLRLDAPVNSRKGAVDYERKVRTEIAAGTWKRSEPVTLQAFARDFLAWAKANRTAATHRDYECTCEQHLIPLWGRRQLGAIGPEQVEQYKAAKLEAKLSRKTINNHLACLSKMLHLAVEWGRLRAVPRIEVFRLPRAVDSEYRWLSREEADRLIAAAGGYWQPMIVLALHTGLRMGEIQALRWCDLDLNGGVLRVARSWCAVSAQAKPPKSGRPRDVPLPHAAVVALERHVHRLGCEFVFSTRTGTVIDKPNLGAGLNRICVAAGIEPIGWHVLRHTYATWMANAGMPIRQLQTILGHSTVQMTERYAHAAPVSAVAVDAYFWQCRGRQMDNENG